MADFKIFANAVNKQFNAMSGGELFRTSASGDALFEAYLAAFPAGTNPMFRERTEHDCSCCKHFIRNLGNVVSIDPETLEISTIWDTPDVLPEPYAVVAAAMKQVVLSGQVDNLFRANERQYGHESNHADGITWNHFWARVADHHYAPGKVDEICGKSRTNTNVIFRTAMENMVEEIRTVEDLIAQDNLYRGPEFKDALRAMRTFTETCNRASPVEVPRLVWLQHANLGLASFRNSAIGSLVLDLKSGTSLEDAVRAFEYKVAPHNYRRSKSLITPAMINKAVDTLKELGLAEAVNRRAARLSDVSVNNVIWADSKAQTTMKDATDDLRNALMSGVTTGRTSATGGQECSIDSFLQLVQGAKEVAVILQPNQMKNMVSLTTSDDPSKIFNWDNPFAWSYTGDVTDSLEERVKAAGGKVGGALRVSLAWGNTDDLDLHCRTPRGNHIYYACRGDELNYREGRVLDVDANAPGTNVTTTPVENMNFSRLMDGTYRFYVNTYTSRSSINKGFTLEVATPTTSWLFHGDTPGTRDIPIHIVVRDGAVTDVKPGTDLVPSGMRTKEVWGIKSGEEVPVDAIMLSPNYWDEQKGKGNKHFFFMLRGCVNPDPVRGIYNEYLRPDLMEHRKVFEVMGDRTKAAPDPQGLSGVGFSSTVREKVTFRITHNDGRKAQYVVQI